MIFSNKMLSYSYYLENCSIAAQTAYMTRSETKKGQSHGLGFLVSPEKNPERGSTLYVIRQYDDILSEKRQWYIIIIVPVHLHHDVI